MTKIIAYTALHYGKDYLGSAIRSVIDYVDEYHVLYTPIGSHGHRTETPCPETRDELLEIALSAGSKLRWHEGVWPYEGAQRDAIFGCAPDADIVIALDSDEIWPDNLVRVAIESTERFPYVRTWRVPIIHYWRSFHRAVLHDPAYPVRLINTRATDNKEMYVTVGDSENNRTASINHMGYAQRSEIVQYKQLTHGHKGEWRRDVDWFNDKFMANAQHDTHPVGSEYWNPEDVNPLDYMPSWMSEHPYFGKAVIE